MISPKPLRRAPPNVPTQNLPMLSIHDMTVGPILALWHYASRFEPIVMSWMKTVKLSTFMTKDIGMKN